jgi:hypothetical protein
MIDGRIETVTALLKKMRDLSGQLHEILEPEIMSFEVIRGDLEKKRHDLKVLEEKKTLCIVKIDEATATAAKILETANEEAGKIIAQAKDAALSRNKESLRLMEVVKQYALDVDRKRYMKLREEAEKAVA